MNKTYNFGGNLLGDPIQMLPVDEIPPTIEECNILNRIFTPAIQKGGKFKEDMKFLLVVIILFIIISLPQFKTLLSKLIPIIEKSVYIDVLTRGIILALLVYIYQNIHLVMKKN